MTLAICQKCGYRWNLADSKLFSYDVHSMYRHSYCDGGNIMVIHQYLKIGSI